MHNKSRPERKLLIPCIWMSTGFLAWYLSIYLFSYILSPMLITTVRETNTITQSALIKEFTNMLFANIADFTLCFVCAILLSFFTRYTILRLSLFIIGAIAFSVYTQVEGLISYMEIYSKLPAWATPLVLQELISSLLIIPLLAFAGSKIGNYLKMRRRST